MAAVIPAPADVVTDPVYSSPVAWTSHRDVETSPYVTAGLTVTTQPYGRPADTHGGELTWS